MAEEEDTSVELTGSQEPIKPRPSSVRSEYRIIHEMHHRSMPAEMPNCSPAYRKSKESGKWRYIIIAAIGIVAVIIVLYYIFR